VEDYDSPLARWCHAVSQTNYQCRRQNQANGKLYTVQYFERNRIEYHPENQGTKYEFQLGLLGVEYFTAKYGAKL
jgi:hypothetical protein